MPTLTPVGDYLARHRARHVEELIDFLRIPSISALPQYASEVRRAAIWLADRLTQAGLTKAKVRETGGHPVVTAQYGDDPAKPSVLIYGHFDVQPVDPEDAWTHPPFTPTIIEDAIYARGASDDKGQVLMQVAALEAWLNTAHDLPVNVRLLFEGEEEIGSVHLETFIRQHAAHLGGDFAVISDTPMFARDMPAICYGLRGLVSLEVTVRGAYQDLHSGVYGGAVANPAHALAHLVDSLHDSYGRVAVDHFYDGVAEPTAEERRVFSELPFDEPALARRLKVPRLMGEAGFTSLERTWLRPTVEVNGMWSGFIGEGRKTIIPATAQAKITCRLVPWQDPQSVVQSLVHHLHAFCPPGVELAVAVGEASPATLTALDHPAVAAATRATASVFGQTPRYIRMGGSIPVVVTLQEVLKMPTVLLGFALPDENFHAPNEHFHLANFSRGAQTLAAFWAEIGPTDLVKHGGNNSE